MNSSARFPKIHQEVPAHLAANALACRILAGQPLDQGHGLGVEAGSLSLDFELARRSTATSCRSITISMSFDADDRANSTNHDKAVAKNR